MTPQFAQTLRACGWTVTVGREQFPREVAERYPKLPEPIRAFLQSVTIAVNAEDTAWFITPSSVRAPGAFRWNEWELASLAAAEADHSWQEDIREFWDNHFPFLLSVRDGYAYLATIVTGPRAGEIVYGREPEFEATTTIAADFSGFQELFVAAARGRFRSPELASAIGAMSN